MARTPLEHDIQKAWALWYGGEQRQDGSWKVVPAQLPGVMWWHVPNGGERRDGFEGKRLKELGVKAGVPDITLLWGATFFLEFKKGGGRLSPAQIDMHPRLIAAGARIATVDDLDDAKATVRAWGLCQEC